MDFRKLGYELFSAKWFLKDDVLSTERPSSILKSSMMWVLLYSIRDYLKLTNAAVVGSFS